MDPHQFNADPQPAFHLNADPDLRLQCGSRTCPSSKQCESATTVLLTLQGSILSLHTFTFIVSVYGTPRLHFQPLTLLNFASPDQLCTLMRSQADPDPLPSCCGCHIMDPYSRFYTSPSFQWPLPLFPPAGQSAFTSSRCGRGIPPPPHPNSPLYRTIWKSTAICKVR